MSFMPIVIELTGLLLVILVIILVANQEEKESTKEAYKYNPYLSFIFGQTRSKSYSFGNYWRFLWNENKMKKLTLRRKLLIWFGLLLNLEFLLFLLLGWVTWECLEDSQLRIIFLTIWFFLVASWIKRGVYNVVPNSFKIDFKIIYRIGTWILYFLFWSYLTDLSNAQDVIDKNSYNFVNFDYNGKNYRTRRSDSLSYIGSTQQYIFIRNIKTDENLIFDKNAISSFSTGRNLLEADSIPSIKLKKNLKKDSLKNIISAPDSTAERANYIPEQGYIPDEVTALKVAETIWLPIYGKMIYDEKPFHVELKDGVWFVSGSLPEDMVGGVAEIEIQKSDGKILRVIHGK